MHFGTPALLLLLVALLPAAAALLWAARWRVRAARRLAGPAVPADRAHVRRALKAACVLFALAALAAAAARPQAGTRRILLPREGSDVMIVLDVSASMLATDVDPSRIERAKAILTSLLDQTQGDRVGMVVFAGSPGLRLPLTTDIAAAREQIRSTAIKEGGLAAGTGIGDAVRAAVSFMPAESDRRGRVLVLVSDGEDLAGNPADAVAQARDKGITVYTVGVGTEAGGGIVVPGPNGRAQTRVDPQTGQPAVTHRDEGLLRSLAAAGKGRYIDGNDAGASAQLAGEVGRLARARFESQEGTVPIERFQWPAAAALVLIALDFLIADRRPRRGRDRHTTAGPGRPAAPGRKAA